MENDLHGLSDQPERTESSAAREVLEQLDADGSRLAARLVTPWWYHLALGAICAVFAASQAFPGPVAISLVVTGIVLLPVLTLAYNRRYGISTTRPAGPRSTRLLLMTLAALVLAMACSLAIAFLALSAWWALAPAAFVFCTTVVLGRRYDDALRDELGERAGRLR